MSSFLVHSARRAGFAGLLALFCAVPGLADDPAAQSEALDAALPTVVRELVAESCLDCHDSSTKEAGLDLESLSTDLADSAAFGKWVKVHDRVKKGEMPPELAEHPSDADRAKMVAALAESLTAADETRRREQGRSALRRLNRYEYENTLRDLLALPNLDVRDMLPPDGGHHGFDKSAGALDFSHVQIARFLDVADEALAHALTPGLGQPQHRRRRVELKGPENVRQQLTGLYSLLKQGNAAPMTGHVPDRTLVVDRGDFSKSDPGFVRDPAPHFDGIACFVNSAGNRNMFVGAFTVETSGEYLLRVTGFGTRNERGRIVSSDRTETVAFYADGQRLLGRCDLPPDRSTTAECRVWLNAGERVQVLPVSVPYDDLKLSERLEPFPWHHFSTYGVCFQALEMEGPLGEWPPESHRRLFGDLPQRAIDTPEPSNTNAAGRSYEVVSENPDRDAERLLRSFVARALRRPTTDADVEIPLAITREQLAKGDPFTSAMLCGYRAVLTSPDFLLLSLTTAQSAADGVDAEDRPPAGDRPLDDFALASRLSYFLWCSPPDDELRRLAAEGRLSDPVVLHDQVDRLLDNRNSNRFVDHFVHHWMALAYMDVTEPDANLYPEFNQLLNESAPAETKAYFAEMLKHDLPARYAAASDFLTINQRLAELYGIEGVHGSAIRRVPIPADSLRGGFLTQASILRVNANGTTTSPVYRGLFVQGTLLGDHPPPPPEEVPAVEPDISGATTIREQLAAHRAEPLCATCHAKIDPPGFALESFDVIGGYRTRYRSLEQGDTVDVMLDGKPVKYLAGQPVDSAGVTTEGDRFDDVRGFRRLLVERERELGHAMLEALVVYATGAAPSFADRERVEALLDRAEPNHYGPRTLIHELVQSDLFRKP